MSEFDDPPFIVMRLTYGVRILLYLLDHESAYQNELKHAFGGEYETIKRALKIMTELGYLTQKDLETLGRKAAAIIQRTHQELRALSPNAHGKGTRTA